jgi:hypothetical protein
MPQRCNLFHARSREGPGHRKLEENFDLARRMS